jgi:hypothetical protein
MEKFPGYSQYQLELEMAQASRATGNEGKARVCARRAAGIIAGEYLIRLGIHLSDQSAYARLQYLASLAEIPGEIRQVIEHFLVRVYSDQNLPIPADLIAEAGWLESKLLNQ